MTIVSTIPADFYTYVLPFLFVLAVSYFVLSFVMPKHQSARALISIVLAFLVLPAGPTLGPFLESMGMAIAVLITFGLVAMIFLAALGHEANVFSQHSKYLIPIALVVAVIVFVAAGGLKILGIEIITSSIDPSWLILIGVIVIAVWILTIEPKAKT